LDSFTSTAPEIKIDGAAWAPENHAAAPGGKTARRISADSAPANRFPALFADVEI